MKNEHYGYELIVDLKECDTRLFNREDVKDFFIDLCRLIEMERCEYHFWDDIGVPEKWRAVTPQTKGISAVQFILTSTIVIHTLELTGEVFVNIFSCKTFDQKLAEDFTRRYFDGKMTKNLFIERG